MSVKNGNDNKPLKELIDVGSEIVGGAASASIGFLVAGPPGAIAGAATSPLLTHAFRRVASEIKSRVLGPREEVRIGATIIYAREMIEENLSSGKQIRQDDFFSAQGNDRPTSEEILESVLLIAQREPQEKKLRFYGNLMANIAFHPEVDRGMANLLIRLAERLSYRQLCVLALLADKDNYELRRENYHNEEDASLAVMSLVQEIFDLETQGMLNASGSALLDLTGVCPGMMNLQGTGAALYNYMELWRVDRKDVAEVAALLH